MVMSFTQALDAEIAALEQEIGADPRLVKLRELKRVRALYGTPPPASNGEAALNDSVPSQLRGENLTSLFNNHVMSTTALQRESARTPGRKPSPERIRAMTEAVGFLRGKTEPTKTADIYAHLLSRGIRLAGDDPQNNLSAMLNKAPEFQSHGRIGWTLAGGVFD
jgi:hypothetical protein